MANFEMNALKATSENAKRRSFQFDSIHSLEKFRGGLGGVRRGEQRNQHGDGVLLWLRAVRPRASWAASWAARWAAITICTGRHLAIFSIDRSEEMSFFQGLCVLQYDS